MSDNFGSALTVLARAIVAPSGLRARGVPRPLKELPDLPKDLHRRLAGIRPKDVEDYLRGLRKFFHGILEFVDDLDQTDEREIKILLAKVEALEETARQLRETLARVKADRNMLEEQARLLKAELKLLHTASRSKSENAPKADPAEVVSTGVPPVEVQKEEPPSDAAKSTKES